MCVKQEIYRARSCLNLFSIRYVLEVQNETYYVSPSPICAFLNYVATILMLYDNNFYLYQSRTSLIDSNRIPADSRHALDCLHNTIKLYQNKTMVLFQNVTMVIFQKRNHGYSLIMLTKNRVIFHCTMYSYATILQQNHGSISPITFCIVLL